MAVGLVGAGVRLSFCLARAARTETSSAYHILLQELRRVEPVIKTSEAAE